MDGIYDVVPPLTGDEFVRSATAVIRTAILLRHGITWTHVARAIAQMIAEAERAGHGR
jgi:hypothetical protein